ncbi:helix-turn-helix domain-containing protein [Haloarcula laminariae]|uniref:helix-turn-helix domain-containing protein n=1 Tax=Haloarcula laminariae TaxID=2961577 RepID=UPI002405257C|nr:bacterio-opsin activator domain-containing protein [Halomicroarcula sp. FL173]
MSDTPERERPRSVCEVEFSVQDSRYPFVRVSEDEQCLLKLAEMFPRPDGHAEFFTVTDADPIRVAARASEHESLDVTLLREGERSGFFEFLVSDRCPAVKLAELGALTRSVVGKDGTGRIVAEIPPQQDASAIIEVFSDEYPDADLVTKREKEALDPRFPQSAFRQLLHRHLTERQREVLQTAFEMGYYEWPRECTGSDVAVELGITSATFSEHIKAAERNLFGALFNRQLREPGDV